MNPQAVTENVLKHVDGDYSNLLQQVFYFSRRFQPVVKGENSFKLRIAEVKKRFHVLSVSDGTIWEALQKTNRLSR